MSKELPVLVVTNPIWLDLFRRGVEDPGWGRHPIDQHAIAMAIHTLAGTIQNEEERGVMQKSALHLMQYTLNDLSRESGKS